jgi:hypothetical protein
MDHVVPRGLWKVAKPPLMMTVPAHLKCNRGFSSDEEYFRSILTTQIQNGQSEAADRAAAAVHRSIERLPHLLDTILKDVRVAQVQGEAGDPIDEYTFSSSVPRVSRVLSKIAAGIYFHDHRRPLPKHLTTYAPPMDKLFAETVAPFYKGNQWGGSGDGVFAYWFRRYAPSDGPPLEGSVFWGFKFFGLVDYVALSIPDTVFQKYERAAKQSQTGVPGQNRPCPCGSERKFKHCCGRGRAS